MDGSVRSARTSKQRPGLGDGFDQADADMQGISLEGSITSLPRLARSRPSDRAARRKALEGRLRDAQARVTLEVAQPLAHGRCALVGLFCVELIRFAAWWQGIVPGWSVFGMHFLTTASDFSCLACAVPLFVVGVQGQCVTMGCLGPMLTLVFAMCLVDLSAFCAYMVVATPRPLSPGAQSMLDLCEAVIGVWEFALVASVALQISLCACSWRVYRELRTFGLYPPGSEPAGVGEKRNVSMLEVMCEAEDVELLAECEMANCAEQYGIFPCVEISPAESMPSSTPGVRSLPSQGKPAEDRRQADLQPRATPPGLGAPLLAARGAGQRPPATSPAVVAPPPPPSSGASVPRVVPPSPFPEVVRLVDPVQHVSLQKPASAEHTEETTVQVAAALPALLASPRSSGSSKEEVPVQLAAAAAAGGGGGPPQQPLLPPAAQPPSARHMELASAAPPQRSARAGCGSIGSPGSRTDSFLDARERVGAATVQSPPRKMSA